MPIQPTDASCQAISSQASSISGIDGSRPPASFGFWTCIRPLRHRPSTTSLVRVRSRSLASAFSRTTSRRERAMRRAGLSVSAWRSRGVGSGTGGLLQRWIGGATY